MGLKACAPSGAIALQNKLPLVSLVESGGANPSDVPGRHLRGRRAQRQPGAPVSAAGFLQIAVVHGSSTAGGAYLPGLSDYVVLVKGPLQHLPGLTRPW